MTSPKIKAQDGWGQNLMRVSACLPATLSISQRHCSASSSGLRQPKRSQIQLEHKALIALNVMCAVFFYSPGWVLSLPAEGDSVEMVLWTETELLAGVWGGHGCRFWDGAWRRRPGKEAFWFRTWPRCWLPVWKYWVRECQSVYPKELGRWLSSGLLGGHPVQIGVCVCVCVCVCVSRNHGSLEDCISCLFLAMWWADLTDVRDFQLFSLILVLWTGLEKHCAPILWKISCV